MAVLNCDQTLIGFIRSTDLLPVLLAYIIGTNIAALNATVTKNIINPLVSFAFNGNKLEHNYILLRKGGKAPYATIDDANADQDAIVLGYGFVISEVISLLIVILSIFFIFRSVCSISRLKNVSMNKT